MDTVFSEIRMAAWDFAQISTCFLLTMLVFFGVKSKKYFWLKYILLLTFILQCGLVILFKNGLPIKLFAALMLMTTLIVETVINRRRKNLGMFEPEL